MDPEKITIVSILLAGLSITGTVIGVLWRKYNDVYVKLEQYNQVTLKRLDDCEEDRMRLWAVIAGLKAVSDVTQGVKIP